MSKKICDKLKNGDKIELLKEPNYICKTCNISSVKEMEVCKPKKLKRA
ncbi:MAG: hypothetical protein HQ565_07715 [Bacteroidetes bacterium]|nr:hypothetical protein [Bacteroidota bacterium]